MKVFVSRIVPEIAISILKNAGHELVIWTEKRDIEKEELTALCQGQDGLLSVGQNVIDKPFLYACSHLKVIGQMAVGYDNIDVATATALNIPVGNTPGVLSNATADTAFLLMMAVSRKAFYMHQKIINGEWGFYEPTSDLGMELSERTLGIFGLGKIGFEMARRCIGAYHMKVIYCNRNPNPLAETELGATRVSFEELLAQSDVLSVHTALTAETKGIFDLAVFKKMKKTAIFINTARGAIHQEPDLIEAMQKKIIWGCGLDVTNPEPMSSDNPLLYMPNAAVLPHIGSATEDTRNAMAKMAAENIIAGLRGERLPNPVNPEVYLKS
jgi:glyoxylate reductase